MTASRVSVQLYTSTPSGPVNWRLLSANNRECGRGVGGFIGVEQCLSTVAALQGDLHLATQRTRRTIDQRWTWNIEIDGQVVAAASRSVDRLVRCERMAVQFLTEFGRAPVRVGIVVSGARRWGSVA